MINIRKCLVGCVLLALIISGCQRAVINQTETSNNQGLITPSPETENQISTNNAELVETTPVVSAPTASIIPPKPSSPNDKDIEDAIFKCIHSTKEDIIKMLGDDYKIVYTGAEASYEGYYYNQYGITIIYDFDRVDSTVGSIQIDKDIEILGVEAGLTFSQIEEILGRAPIYETFIESPGNTAYELFYKINDCIVSFLSLNEDGSNSSLTILRGLRRNVGEIRNNETNEIEGYWHVDEITGDLTRIRLKGGGPVVIDKGFIEGRIISVSENLGNSQLKPCIIVATENDGVFTIYRGLDYQDFREYRFCDDFGKKFPEIKKVECKIDSSGEITRYVIDVTPMDKNSPTIMLDSNNDIASLWAIKNE